MTILVACNASAHGQAALKTALGEATRRAQPLVVLVLDPGDTVAPQLSDLLAAHPGLPDQQSADQPADQPKQPDQPDQPGQVEVSWRFRPASVDPADAILDAADELAPTLIVLGSRKRSSMGTFVMGTTTQRVLLDASAPVLVVKDAYEHL